MHEVNPSRTALRVALRRAAHQLHDAKPLVFDDPLAVRILGKEFYEEVKRTPDSVKRPFSAALRAFMVVRARLAEDTLAEGVRELGVRQYLVLGAGLDTFACRNPYPEVRVFEVDHPATQTWKKTMLHPTLTRRVLVPKSHSLQDRLAVAPHPLQKAILVREALAKQTGTSEDDMFVRVLVRTARSAVTNSARTHGTCRRGRTTPRDGATSCSSSLQTRRCWRGRQSSVWARGGSWTRCHCRQ